MIMTMMTMVRKDTEVVKEWEEGKRRQTKVPDIEIQITGDECLIKTSIRDLRVTEIELDTGGQMVGRIRPDRPAGVGVVMVLMTRICYQICTQGWDSEQCKFAKNNVDLGQFTSC